MLIRHFSITIIFAITLTITLAADITITCVNKGDQSPWALITTPKFKTCELQTDLKSTDAIKDALADTATITKADIEIFVVDGKRIPKIPIGLKTVFTNLIGLKIDNTNFKILEGDSLTTITGLKYLAVTNSKIDVIFADTFKNLALELIDLTGNPIMFMSSSVLDGPGAALKYLYLEVLCLFGTDPLSATDNAGVTALKAAANLKCVDSKKLETSLFSTTRDFLEASESSGECEPCTDENDCPAEDCSEELEEVNLRLNSTVDELAVCNNDNSALNDDVRKLQQEIDELKALTNVTADGTCGYKVVSSVYSCYAKISVKTAADQTVKWNGTHLSGKVNNQVLSMVIYGQTVEILPLNIGSTFTNLKYLTVKNSGLTKINAGDFKNLGKLETLEISGNNITTIDAAAFAELIKLKELELSANRITSLPSKVFETLPLSILNLSGNLLKIRYDIISASNSISEAYLGNNKANFPLDRTLIWRLQKAVKIDLTGTGCNFNLDKVAKPETFMAFYSNIASNC